MGRGLAQGLPAGEAGLCTPTRSLGSPMPRPPRGTCACTDSALSSAVRGRGGGVPGCPPPRTEGSAHVTDASRSPKPELEAPLGPGTPVFPMPPPPPRGLETKRYQLPGAASQGAAPAALGPCPVQGRALGFASLSATSARLQNPPCCLVPAGRTWEWGSVAHGASRTGGPPACVQGPPPACRAPRLRAMVNTILSEIRSTANDYLCLVPPF